jgi:hypothetical protein
MVEFSLPETRREYLRVLGMDRQEFKVLAFVFWAAFLSNQAAAVDIQHYTIGGTGLECFRFAILTDTHADQNAAKNSSLREAVDVVIQINNDLDPRNDVSFVVILGDLIRGEARDDGTWKVETDYRLEYERVEAELERLKLPHASDASNASEAVSYSVIASLNVSKTSAPPVSSNMRLYHSGKRSISFE